LGWECTTGHLYPVWQPDSPQPLTSAENQDAAVHDEAGCLAQHRLCPHHKAARGEAKHLQLRAVHTTETIRMQVVLLGEHNTKIGPCLAAAARIVFQSWQCPRAHRMGAGSVASRNGHLVPIWLPLIGSSFHLWQAGCRVVGKAQHPPGAPRGAQVVIHTRVSLG
jgi:hypothetical protein